MGWYYLVFFSVYYHGSAFFLAAYVATFAFANARTYQLLERFVVDKDPVRCFWVFLKFSFRNFFFLQLHFYSKFGKSLLQIFNRFFNFTFG